MGPIEIHTEHRDGLLLVEGLVESIHYSCHCTPKKKPLQQSSLKVDAKGTKPTKSLLQGSPLEVEAKASKPTKNLLQWSSLKADAKGTKPTKNLLQWSPLEVDAKGTKPLIFYFWAVTKTCGSQINLH